MVGDRFVEVNDSLSVGELCAAIDFAISTCFPDDLWVTGAVSGIRRTKPGHVYFDFIDPSDLGQASASTLSVALFANVKHQINAILKKSGAARIEDGVELRIKARVEYYARQGRVQLIMTSIDPSYTLGKLEEARTLLLAELREAGLIDLNGQLEMPALPLRVALITSEGSAAEADFLHEIELSGLPFEITKLDVRVQGDEAPALIAKAIEAAQDLDVDAIALIRGGGAKTDLASFDHRSVALAIVHSTIPVVVGVGHEIDRSVADEVAHTAAKTPTACAGVFIDRVTAFAQRLDAAAKRLGTAGLLATQRHSARIDLLWQRTGAAAERALTEQRHHIDRAELRAGALDPAVTLARGWSITRTQSGELVRSTNQIEVGAVLTTLVHDGTLTSSVTKTATKK